MRGSLVALLLLARVAGRCLTTRRWPSSVVREEVARLEALAAELRRRRLAAAIYKTAVADGDERLAALVADGERKRRGCW